MLPQPSIPYPDDDASPLISAAGQEFAFSEADFRSFVDLAKSLTGIALSESKRNLVYSRLSRRLRVLGMRSFRDYREYLSSPSGRDEIERFINAISTNLTKLFRESHHFDHLCGHVAKPYAAKEATGRCGRLRVWSAGCSTGEEAYSIALVLRRELRAPQDLDLRILATDIDTEVLSKAKAGEYPVAALADIPPQYRDMVPPPGGGASRLVSMSQDLKDLIRFRHLNLLKDWPFEGKFDAIFCRNVMIYFDGPTKTDLIGRFIDRLNPGGWLYIGHSESLLGTNSRLKLLGRTTYQRIA